jgi:adenine phosphoribosyltransferase
LDPEVWATPKTLDSISRLPYHGRLLLRLTAIDLLRLAKQKMTYRELAKLISSQPTLVARHVKARMLPSYGYCVRILKTLDPIAGLKASLVSLPFENGLADTSRLLSEPALLRLAAADCIMRFAGYRVTRILTVSCNSVPLATAISMMLMVPVATAKTHMDAGTGGDFLEVAKGVVGERLEVLYLPKEALKRRDSVLIVLDVVRSGRTAGALVDLVEHAEAEVAGVYCLIGFREGLERLKARGLRVEAVMEVEM